MKVLLVEDDPKVASHIANGLLGEGHECITVGDGTSGYQQASSNELDAVILDVMLPGKSGFEILEELRAQDTTADLPVLMLTARGQKKDREMAQAHGADRFMTKPFSNAEVLEEVRALVANA